MLRILPSTPGTWAAVAVLVLSSGSAAQLVVQDGDDLEAVVAAAPSGSVIVIDSDSEFAASLAWSGKALTIQAAPGRKPTIRASALSPTIDLAPGVPGTRAVLRDLTLAGFGPIGPGVSTMVLNATGAGPARPTSLLVERCRLIGATSLDVLAGQELSARFVDSSFRGNFGATGQAGSRVSVAVQGGEFVKIFLVSGSDDSMRVHAAGAAFRGPAQVGGSAAHQGELAFEDCDFDSLTIGGAGDSQTSVALVDSRVDSDLTIQSSGGLLTAVRVSGSEIGGDLEVTPMLLDQLDLRVADSSVDGDVLIWPFQTSTQSAYVELRRDRFAGGLFANGSTSQNLSLLAESCLFAATTPQAAPGVALTDAASARFVNVTVTGYPSGVLSQDSTGGQTFENLLLFGNGADVVPTVPPAQIQNSLIADGTFDGVNGNFAATPLVDGDLVLLPGSPGVDAGNDLAVGLGRLDVYGQPRIQDGDGDGVARVDVGAAETQR